MMRRFNHEFASIVLLVLLLSSCSSQPQVAEVQETADLVIRGGHLIDMVSDESSIRSVKGLVVNDGKIEKILSSDSSEDLPEGTRVVNAQGLYILPGLVDSHVHFRPWFPKPFLQYGVTTLMDTGPCGDGCEENPNDWILKYQRALNAPDSDGPTLHITGMKIDGPDGKIDKSVWRVQSLDEVTEKIDFLVSIGAGAIKAEEYLPKNYRAKLMQEANQRGLPVVGHSRDARESIFVGMKFIEHMTPIAQSLSPKKKGAKGPAILMDISGAAELIQLMVENQVYLNPTLLGRHSYLSERAASFAEVDRELLGQELFREIPQEIGQDMVARHLRAEKLAPAERKKLTQEYENIQRFVGELSASGGLVLAATDTSSSRVPGISVYREIQLLVDAGVPNYKALLGATRYPAQLWNMTDTIGTLQEGLQADVLVLGSNPVDNVSAVLDIQYVVRKGKILREPAH